MSFYFGAAAVLLCLLQFGLLSGMVASIVASISLYLIADSLFFIIFLNLEILIIGILLNRGVFMLMASIVYWSLVGMPVTFAIFYLANPDFAFNSLLLIMKQGINGVLYASIASVIAPFLPESWFKVNRGSQFPAMSRKIFEHFSTITTITGLVTGLVLVQLSIRDNENQLQKNLANKAAQASAFITNYIESHRVKIINAADNLTLYRQSTVSPVSLLNQMQDNYPGFLTMLIADEEGQIIAGAPKSFYEVLLKTPKEQRTVLDRDYFIEAKRNADSYISQAFVSRGFGSDIIVAVSAPFFDGDEFDGIVEGSLNLNHLKTIEDGLAQDSDSLFVLVDENDKILYASPSLNKNPFDKFNHVILRKNSFATGASLLMLKGAEKSGNYFYESKPTINQWRVIILRNASLISNIAQTNYQYLMGIFAAVFILTFVISKLLSKNLTKPLETIVSSLSMENLRDNNIEDSVFTQETHSLRKRLEQAKQVYIDFHEELKLEVDKRTSELSEANEKLERLSREDGLTGLFNRRAFDEALQNEMKTSIRLKTPLCLALVDIDLFKNINDSYGHPIGDQFIQKLGRMLRQHMQRETDIVARVGGEEFAILFHAESPIACESKLESCRGAAMAIKIETEGKKVGISVSMGAIFITPNPGTKPNQLYSLADKLLYQSKAGGRNRLTFNTIE